ncbi:MAG: glycosyltransferase family 39 protein [Nanoarchaeota archaeon]
MKKPTLIIKLRQNIPLIIILLIALFLRLYNLQYMEFKGDEAFNSIKALKFVNEGEIPLFSSIGTTGIHEPPIFIYLLSIPYLFSKNPVIAAGFIALLNAFGILICYLLVKKFYNKRAAIISSAFYAASPWQILFSRKIWAQDLLAFFAIVFLYFIFNAIYEKKKSHLIYALATLGILIQIHLSALYFFPVAAIALAANYKKLNEKIKNFSSIKSTKYFLYNENKKYLFIGIILFLLSFSPYFAFQIKNNFADIRTALELAKKDTAFHSSAFIIPFTLVSTKGFEPLFGTDFNDFGNTALRISFFDIFAMAMLFLSIAFLFSYTKKSSILILWLVIGTLFLAFSKVEAIDAHYFASFFPLYFIIIGNMLDIFIKAMHKKIKPVVYLLIILTLAYQIAFNISFLSFIEKSQCINGDYGMPYQHRLNNMEKTMDKFETTNTDIREINELSCNCAKCDILAAEFMLMHIKN